MQAQAIWKFARISPSKVRIVADVIRKKDVNSAINIVKFANKKAARMMEKVLRSAISNAEVKSESNVDLNKFIVEEVYVNEGPMLKRFRPRAMGRAFRIRKRTSHITIVIGNNEVEI